MLKASPDSEQFHIPGEDCTDLGLVDLPGFRTAFLQLLPRTGTATPVPRRRSYAKDDAMQQLAKKIDSLVFKFMSATQKRVTESQFDELGTCAVNQ